MVVYLPYRKAWAIYALATSSTGMVNTATHLSDQVQRATSRQQDCREDKCPLLILALQPSIELPGMAQSAGVSI